MSSEGFSVAGQGDVDEILLVPQVAEGGQDGRLEVVPSEAVELLLLFHGGRFVVVGPRYSDF